MSWQAGSTILGLGVAIFSLVAPMMGLTLPRWLLSTLLAFSVVLIFIWPVSVAVAWLPKQRSLGSLLLFISIGAILGGAIFGIVWSTTWESDPVPFNVEIVSNLVSESGPITMHVVTYPSMFGNTLSPIFYLTYLKITNLQNIPSAIIDLSIAASKERTGPWESLKPIPLDHTKLYSVGIKTPYPKNLVIPRGTYRLATARTQEDLRYSALLNASPILQSELAKPIQPHYTVGGWIALDSPLHKGLTPGQFYFRITVRDGANKGGAFVVPTHIPSSESPSLDIDPPSLGVTGILEDLSHFTVRYYSDPYPRNQ